MRTKYGKLKVGDVIFLGRFSDKGLWIVESLNPDNEALLSKVQPDGVGVITIRRYIEYIDWCYGKQIEI